MTTEKTIWLWVRALILAQKGKTKVERKMTIKILVKLLKRQKKEYLLPKILAQFQKDCLKKEKIELILTRRYGPGLIGEIKKRLGLIFGQDKILVPSFNKELIGGFRLKTESFLVEASIRGFLAEIKKILWKK